MNFISDGGVSFIDHVIESRVLAQACSPANPCAIPSAITQASCTLAATYGGGNCTNQQFAGNLVFSRSPLDLPNTFYNFNTNNTLQIWKTVVTSNLSGGYPTAVTATYSLTAVNGAGVYTGSTAACVSNACVGNNITVTGFANANNNISAVVTASTATTLTVSATTTAKRMREAQPPATRSRARCTWISPATVAAPFPARCCQAITTRHGRGLFKRRTRAACLSQWEAVAVTKRSRNNQASR